jgi:small subunit ribosomal protein S2
MGKQEIGRSPPRRREAAPNLEGIARWTSCADAIIVIDTTREAIAVAEAKRLRFRQWRSSIQMPTRTDQLPIAGNDDAIRASYRSAEARGCDRLRHTLDRKSRSRGVSE